MSARSSVTVPDGSPRPLIRGIPSPVWSTPASLPPGTQANIR
jgi:hypothetical protein